MPSEAENINYLYLVLTNDGTPVIDWDAVSAALELNKGAVTKRWSRLKQAMDRNEVPGGTTYQFLWLCVKHHKRTQPPNWNDIASKANTTSGAASKRYSRMKKAFEENDIAPNTAPRSPVKNTPAKAKATPKSTVKKSQKTTASSGGDEDNAQTTLSTKRKRTSTTKNVAPTDDDEAKIKRDPGNEDEDDKLLGWTNPKRARVGKNNVKVIPKPKAKSTVKKEETDVDDEDSFFDAQEDLERQEQAEETHDDEYAVHHPEPADLLDFSDGVI